MGSDLSNKNNINNLSLDLGAFRAQERRFCPQKR